MKKRYYIDSCIYLNLWQKEVDKNTGVKLWKLAQNFFEKAEEEGFTIYYSGFLLKELKYILSENEFYKKRLLFESSPGFVRLFLSEQEYEETRKIEKEVNFEISFFDVKELDENSILQDGVSSLSIQSTSPLANSSFQAGVGHRAFDIIHMFLARKSNSILITRDKKLIEISKLYKTEVKRPEEL